MAESSLEVPPGTEAWRGPAPEPITGVCITLIGVVLLQVLVLPEVRSVAYWVKSVLEVLVLGVLLISYVVDRGTRRRHQHEYSDLVWWASTALIVLLTITNAGSGLLLVSQILADSDSIDTFRLLSAAGSVYATNIVVFALWYWHSDRGGQGRRAGGTGPTPPDFIFPQMTDPDLAPLTWRPRFVDYLYVSFTNAAAFGPTDAMPSARWAKLAMMGQATLALVLIALVVSRLVGLLS